MNYLPTWNAGKMLRHFFRDETESKQNLVLWFVAVLWRLLFKISCKVSPCYLDVLCTYILNNTHWQLFTYANILICLYFILFYFARASRNELNWSLGIEVRFINFLCKVFVPMLWILNPPLISTLNLTSICSREGNFCHG